MSAPNVENPRYRVDCFHAASLEGNPLGAPVERDLAVYLPPGYFDEPERRYPAVYFLHGYSGNNRQFTVYPTTEGNPNLPIAMLPPALRQQIDMSRLPSYQLFDKLISQGQLPAMIFVQPDGSLHQPNKFGLTSPATGQPMTKGSFYVNSPHTGNYEDYILEVVRHVEANYRTIQDRARRIIAGGSMGGYGALRLALHHPHLFGAAAVLSPGDLTPDRLHHQLRIPIYQALFGPDTAAKLGDTIWRDILDTIDLIWSKDRPLLPTIQRDTNGKVISYDKEAAENWRRASLTHLINQISSHPPPQLGNLRIYLSCEKDDEFGFAQVAERLHSQLQQLGIPHHLKIFDDPQAKLTPHLLGIACQIIPALKYCLPRD